MTDEVTWSSLEIAKLVVAGLTPAVVAALAFWLNRRLKSLEQAQWARQKIVERRIGAYDELGDSLNQLYCYFCYVGSWKEIEPPELIELKRSLDQRAHVDAAFFDPDFLPKYNAFIEMCFATFGSWGTDARLRTLTDQRRRLSSKEWDPSWDECFTGSDEATEPELVQSAYGDLMAYLGRAMGAEQLEAHLFAEAPIPGNYDLRAAGMVTPIEPADGANKGGSVI